MKCGEVEKAVERYQQSIAGDPRESRPHLSMAAALIAKGDDESAQTHLAEYVDANPEELSHRLQHADLLLRLKRMREASAEFERVAADAQNCCESIDHLLIHCQTRLMEIAEIENDEYGLHLHRGMGIYFIARRRACLGEDQGKMCPESILCQAAGELALARLERPQEARPCWYLYEVWTLLDQPRPASHNLRDADANAPFSYLTSVEKNGLNLACTKSRLADTFRR
jgi:tetratricopeptide (TPR) repeat protein